MRQTKHGNATTKSRCTNKQDVDNKNAPGASREVFHGLESVRHLHIRKILVEHSNLRLHTDRTLVAAAHKEKLKTKAEKRSFRSRRWQKRALTASNMRAIPRPVKSKKDATRHKPRVQGSICSGDSGVGGVFIENSLHRAVGNDL